MALSAELQARYSGEYDQDWWEGIILSHPSMTTVRLCNDSQSRQGAVDGTVYTFQAVPFQLLEPTRNAEGKTSVELRISAIGSVAAAFVNQARADRTERILLQYGKWLRSTTTQQQDPLPSLNLTNVAVTNEVLSATAVATDVLNRPFPTEVYTVELFPGLQRR